MWYRNVHRSYVYKKLLIVVKVYLYVEYVPLQIKVYNIGLEIRYVTRKTYLFPQTRRVGFPRAAARQYADARAAIRGLSARQYADCQRGNTRIVSAAMRGRSADLHNAESADERESLRTRSKTGIGC